MTDGRELPAFVTPQLSRRCRCGCELHIAVPRRIDGHGILHHGRHVVMRVPCREHESTPRFRAEELAEQREMSATLGTLEWLVHEINKEVG